MEELKINSEIEEPTAETSNNELEQVDGTSVLRGVRRKYLIEQRIKEQEIDLTEAEKLVDQDIELLKAGIQDYINAKRTLDEVVASIPVSLQDVFWGDLIDSQGFENVNHMEVIEKITSTKEGWLASRHLFRHLDKFSDEVALVLAKKLIDTSSYTTLLEMYFPKYKEADQVKIIDYVVEKGIGAKAFLERLLPQVVLPLDGKIADKLFEMEQSVLVLKNFKKFKDFDVDKIPPYLEENLPYYTNDFATWLIANGKLDYVKYYIGKFKDLDKKIADDLIAAGHLENVIVYSDKFPNLSEDEIIKRAIEIGRGYAVLKYLYKFSKESYGSMESILETDEGIAALVRALGMTDVNNLPKSFAMKLIETGHGDAVANNFDKFVDLGRNEAADKMMATGQSEAVAKNFNKFVSSGMINVFADHISKSNPAKEAESYATKLIERGEIKILADHLNNFKGLSGKVAAKLIEAGYVGVVADSIENFWDRDILEIVRSILKNGGAADIAKNLKKLSKLGTEEAEALAEAGKLAEIGDNLKSFKHGLPSSLADKLFLVGKGAQVAVQINKFKGLDLSEFSNKLIDAGEAHATFSYLDDLDESELLAAVQRIIKEGQISALAENLHRLVGLKVGRGIFDLSIAKSLIKEGYWLEVIKWIGNFQESDHATIAKAIIAKEGGNCFASHIGGFKNLTLEIALQLFKHQHHIVVAQNISNFLASDHNAIAEAMAERTPEKLIACIDDFKNLSLSVAQELIQVSHESVTEHTESFVKFSPEDINKLLISANLQDAKKIIEAFSMSQNEITDSTVLISLGLPSWPSLEKLRIEPELLTDLEAAPQAERGDIFIQYSKEHEWEGNLRGWYGKLSGICGERAANRYLLCACNNGVTAHDALYFVPKLSLEFQEDPAALVRIIESVRSEEDGNRLREHAGAYSTEGLKNCSLPVPATLRDFVRTAILIKKNFIFPENVSPEVKEKISLILESVNDTSALANDLGEKDGSLIRLLENRDGLDESAIIQPIPELAMRISALGDILKSALGSRELVKLSGAIGQLQKEIGPRIFDIQRRALLAEEISLKQVHAETYAKPHDDVELINLKKNHARYLESLKIVKGGNFTITDNKGGADKRIAKLIESLPRFKEASAEGRIEMAFETLKPVFDALCRALTQGKIGNNFQTDPVAAYLVEKVASEESGEQIIQRPGESTIEFWERVSGYMEAAIDQYLALTAKVQKLKDAEDLYRQTEKIISQVTPDAGKAAMKNFLENSESILAEHPEVEQRIENLLASRGINVGDKLVARVLVKSDPRGIVCGDDTNCCMPYGDSKNYEYMYRGDTAYFTVSISRNGEERTIAQSVLVAADKEKTEDKDFSVLAFDNIEIAHAYEKLTPDIAKIYKKAISEYWPEKTIIMGTSYNDDRDLVRSMGQLIRNKYAPLEGELEYSDCFDHGTIVKLRGPLEGERDNLAPRLGFVTPAMLTLGNPLRELLAANFNLAKEDADRLLTTLAPVEQVLYRDRDNDPVFAADNKSAQITIGGQPILLLIALDREQEDTDWDEIEIKETIWAKEATGEQIEESLVTYLSLQPEEGYKIKLPMEIIKKYSLDPDELCERSDFKECTIDAEYAYFKGSPVERDDYYDDYDYDDDY